MYEVVQVNGARVRLARAEGRELGVFLVEATDMWIDQALPIVCFQITMALRASGIGRFGKAYVSNVLNMAGAAMRRERLPLIVCWGIVTA
jgi:hypothetical protein